MTNLTPRSQSLRLGAVLVFVGLPALLLTLSLVDSLQIGSDRLTVEENRRQAAALQRRLARPAAPAGAQISPLSIRAASRTLAMADLQQKLSDAVAAASGRVIETTATEGTDTNEDARDRIDVKAVLDIDNDGLLLLLVRLESGVPLMTIESLSIRRVSGSQAPTNDDTPASGEPPILLRVDLSVSARWTQTSPAAS